jgi:flavodoxin
VSPSRTTSPSDTTAKPAKNPPRILLAFYSRAGENYYYGGRRELKVGNTEVLARMIADLTGCDLHQIHAADPYPDDYDQTVARNVREQQQNAHPAIAGALPDLTPYGTVLLASPIWNIRAPMIMTTFTEALDFAGKTVHPVTTYAMSGLGTTERDYAASCRGASIGRGLAVQGEKAAESQDDVTAWLRTEGML